LKVESSKERLGTYTEDTEDAEKKRKRTGLKTGHYKKKELAGMPALPKKKGKNSL
jgi:hypothetical protein